MVILHPCKLCDEVVYQCWKSTQVAEAITESRWNRHGQSHWNCRKEKFKHHENDTEFGDRDSSCFAYNIFCVAISQNSLILLVIFLLYSILILAYNSGFFYVVRLQFYNILVFRTKWYFFKLVQTTYLFYWFIVSQYTLQVIGE